MGFQGCGNIPLVFVYLVSYHVNSSQLLIIYICTLDLYRFVLLKIYGCCFLFELRKGAAWHSYICTRPIHSMLFFSSLLLLITIEDMDKMGKTFSYLMRLHTSLVFLKVLILSRKCVLFILKRIVVYWYFYKRNSS